MEDAEALEFLEAYTGGECFEGLDTRELIEASFSMGCNKASLSLPICAAASTYNQRPTNLMKVIN
jgi:hypothetical protein